MSSGSSPSIIASTISLASSNAMGLPSGPSGAPSIGTSPSGPSSPSRGTSPSNNSSPSGNSSPSRSSSSPSSNSSSSSRTSSPSGVTSPSSPSSCSSSVISSSAPPSSSVCSSSACSSGCVSSVRASTTNAGGGGMLASKALVIDSGALNTGAGGPGRKLTAVAVPGSVRVTVPRPFTSDTSRIPERCTKVVVPSRSTCPSNSEPRTPICAVGVLIMVWVPLSVPPNFPLA